MSHSHLPKCDSPGQVPRLRPNPRPSPPHCHVCHRRAHRRRCRGRPHRRCGSGRWGRRLHRRRVWLFTSLRHCGGCECERDYLRRRPTAHGDVGGPRGVRGHGLLCVVPMRRGRLQRVGEGGPQVPGASRAALRGMHFHDRVYCRCLALRRVKTRVQLRFPLSGAHSCTASPPSHLLRVFDHTSCCSPHAQVQKIEARPVPGMRIGAVATEPIAAEELYISVPVKAVMDEASARASPAMRLVSATSRTALCLDGHTGLAFYC